MLNSVLYFGRQNCKYSKILEKYLKNNSRKFVSVKSKYKGEIIKKNSILKNYFDYVFCFRSYFILKENILNNCRYAINFHPSLPKYRGVGGVNYAIFNGDKYFGSTIHFINEKIDNGKILKVSKFRILKNDNVETLLKKTHKTLYREAKKFIGKLIVNSNILKNKNIKVNMQWGKKYHNVRSLNKFYEINPNVSKKNFERKLKSTIYKNYKPYVTLHGKRFFV